MGIPANGQQVISKKRVVDHGEVYTGAREVNAMLNLVQQETERIDSRFLEPACGTGNFLAEILARKLRVVEARYKRSQPEYERYAVLAVSSIYGIDILEDNVIACRCRLFELFDEAYTRLYKKRNKDTTKEECRAAVRFLLDCNIIHGDALTLRRVPSPDRGGDPPQPIIFAEWSPVNHNRLKRRDFKFRELLDRAANKELALFAERDYPPVHFLRLTETGNGT